MVRHRQCLSVRCRRLASVPRCFDIMFKLCLLLFVFCNAVFADNDASNPQIIKFAKEEGTPAKSPVITLNGQQNYNAVQQIFYFYAQQRSPFNQNVNRQVPDDYVVTPDVAAHKLHLRHLKWNRARRICIEEGGHLAVIRSVSEEKMLLKLMEDSGKSAAWLGVHDQFEEGDWVTVKDEALGNAGFSKWTTKYPNEPDNYGGAQNCAVLIKEGGMDDVNCDATHPFFCKIDLQNP